jgi:hypothetical protein
MTIVWIEVEVAKMLEILLSPPIAQVHSSAFRP